MKKSVSPAVGNLQPKGMTGEAKMTWITSIPPGTGSYRSGYYTYRRPASASIKVVPTPAAITIDTDGIINDPTDSIEKMQGLKRARSRFGLGHVWTDIQIWWETISWSQQVAIMIGGAFAFIGFVLLPILAWILPSQIN
ncbi:MAG: hypothetical protein WCW03_03760 [Candidatus Paceibacterota bacterium]|jgi:hypothetical protein